MALKDDLKKYLPQSQQGKLSLDEFMDAVGELLDNFKDSIDDFQTYNDFEKVKESQLDNLAQQFDIVYPRNMSDERKRNYLRDVVTLYRSKGTTKSVERVFKLIGWQVLIKEYWIVNPDWYTNPTDIYTITNESGATFDLGLYDTINGDDEFYRNDKIYIDLVDVSGNVYPKRQIYGEPYQATADVNFIKVPYIKIIVTSEDFDLFTQPYTENGNTYTYDTTEEFEILTYIRNYFLDVIRPANVAILEISTPFQLSDTFVFFVHSDTGGASISGTPNISFNNADPYTITRDVGDFVADGFLIESYINVTGSTNNNNRFKIRLVTATQLTLYYETPLVTELTVSGVSIIDEGQTLSTINNGATYDGTSMYGAYNIDRYIMGETMGNFQYGTSQIDYYGVKEDAPDQNIATNYAIGTVGNQKRILLRKNSDIVVTVPADASITIYATRDSHDTVINGSPVWAVIAIGVTNVTAQTHVITGYFSLFVKIDTASSTGTIDTTVNLY